MVTMRTGGIQARWPGRHGQYYNPIIPTNPPFFPSFPPVIRATHQILLPNKRNLPYPYCINNSKKPRHMRRNSIYFFLISASLCWTLGSAAQTKPPAAGADTAKKAAPKATIAEKVKSSRKIEGLITLYQDTATGSVQMYIRKDQLGKEFIYQSFSMGGPTSLFLNQNMIRATWVFTIHKQFDKIEFSQVNTNFWYDPSNAVSKAANVDVPESIFYSDKPAA